MLIHIFNFFFSLKACGCKPQAGKEHGSVVSQLAHFHTGVHAGEGALAHVPRCAALLWAAEQSAGSASPNSQSWLPCVCTKHLERNPGWERDLEHSSSPSPPSSLHLALNESHPQERRQLLNQMHFPSQSLFLGRLLSCRKGEDVQGSWLPLEMLFVSMGGIWEYFPICFLLRLYQGAMCMGRIKPHQNVKRGGFPAEDLSVALPAVVWSEDTKYHYLLMAHWSKILLHDLISHMVGVCPILLRSGFG